MSLASSSMYFLLWHSAPARRERGEREGGREALEEKHARERGDNNDSKRLECVAVNIDDALSGRHRPISVNFSRRKAAQCMPQSDVAVGGE